MATRLALGPLPLHHGPHRPLVYYQGTDLQENSLHDCLSTSFHMLDWAALFALGLFEHSWGGAWKHARTELSFTRRAVLVAGAASATLTLCVDYLPLHTSPRRLILHRAVVKDAHYHLASLHTGRAFISALFSRYSTPVGLQCG